MWQQHQLDTTQYDANKREYGNLKLFDFRGDVRFQILLYQHEPEDEPQAWTLELRRGKEPLDGTRFFY